VTSSVLLHYFYLAAFCLMLAEAVQLLLSTVFVFHVQSTAQTVGLSVAAWGRPDQSLAVMFAKRFEFLVDV